MKNRWPQSPLSEVCQIKPPKAEARCSFLGTDLVSFVPMEDLGIDQKYLIPTQVKPLSEVIDSYTYFAENDVLLAKITPCFENGKLSIAANLTNGIGFGSSEYIVFRPGPFVSKDWLYYFFSRDVFRREGADRMSGAVGHKRLSKEFIEDCHILLPPLPEQQRIVAILDEAFKDVATAKANTEKNLQNAREIFENSLDQIFSQNKPSWIENSLQNLTTKIGSGATPLGGEKSYKSKGISLIRSLNVYDSGFRLKDLAFLDDTQADKLSNVEVQPDDVLLNITGASVARCCIVPQKVLPARVNQHVSIIRSIKSKLSSTFLHYLLTSKLYKSRLLQIGDEGGSTRQAITKTEIQNLQIRYPATLDEQQAIVEKLDSLFKETERLESIYQRKLTALDQLKQSILAQAFSGEL